MARGPPSLPLLLALFCVVARQSSGDERGDNHRGTGNPVAEPSVGNCATVFVSVLAAWDHQQLHRLMDYARIMIESALLHHPQGCACILTNTQAASWIDPLHQMERVEVEVLEDDMIQIDSFSYDRLKAYRQFLMSEAVGQRRNAVLCDADLLFTRSLDDVWSQKPVFDIALTFRDTFQPINTGLILFHGTTLAAGADVLREMLQEYDGVTAGRNPRHMLGDQVAASSWVGRTGWKQGAQERQTAVVGKHRVLLLPATAYNWTPHTGCRIPMSSYVLHFKGREKVKMLRAWHILRRGSAGVAQPSAEMLEEIAWLGVDEPQNKIHKLRHSLIEHCPPV